MIERKGKAWWAYLDARGDLVDDVGAAIFIKVVHDDGKVEFVRSAQQTKEEEQEQT